MKFQSFNLTKNWSFQSSNFDQDWNYSSFKSSADHEIVLISISSDRSVSNLITQQKQFYSWIWIFFITECLNANLSNHWTGSPQKFSAFYYRALKCSLIKKLKALPSWLPRLCHVMRNISASYSHKNACDVTATQLKQHTNKMECPTNISPCPIGIFICPLHLPDATGKRKLIYPTTSL